MKKTVLIFMVTAILVFSVFGVSAAPYYPTENSGSYSYTVSCDVSKIDGIDMTLVEKGASMYGLVAVKGTGSGVNLASADSFVYIDQATVDKDGFVTFTGFLPMGPGPDQIEPETGAVAGETYFEECTLFIGGPGFTTAKQIGVLKDASGVAVEGTVTDTVTASTSSKVATITVYDSNGVQVGTPVTTNAAGEYSAVVPAGEGYKVVCTKPGFLSFTYTGVNVTTALSGVDFNISTLAGDVNNDGIKVELADLRALLVDFNKESGFTYEYSDIDDSGKAELADLRKLLANFNAEPTSNPYTAE